MSLIKCKMHKLRKLANWFFKRTENIFENKTIQGLEVELREELAE